MFKMFDYSHKELKKIEKIAKSIIQLEKKYNDMSDDELKGMTQVLKDRLKTETLDDILVDAFAVCKEAATRVLGMTPFKVQLMGAIAMHRGNIAEMKTGEGKTLTSTMPAYLNGISGKGVHIITVNEYLATRDKEEMGELFNFLNLSVGLNLRELSKDEKREQYACDIMYSTNSEIGFDYLRDHMVVFEKDIVIKRGLNFALIDEIDSILVDEARTPLIISGGAKQTNNLYQIANQVVDKLKEDDYDIDEKSRHASLTEDGIKTVEKMLNIDNLYDVKHVQLTHRINNSLKAQYIFNKDVEYVVHEEEIVLVDSFTGRLMKGRQYNDGLHQAIEAKEGLKIKKETTTLATITYQNFFRMYVKLSGMTGTAKTEEEEFRDIYNMYVIEIPTNKKIVREDAVDSIFVSAKAKYKFLAQDVKERHLLGQPILIGSSSIDTSEIISNLLKKEGVKHELLNAKQHEREAKIIENAGCVGSVTIATNMAGRGTDIKLGEGVVELGGLAVLGTERHESRRIDNQLRGRSGRQGDPGYSKFYISGDDELIRRFGRERFNKNVGKFTKNKKTGEETSLNSRMFSYVIRSAQSQIEGSNYDRRKNILKYDEVLNKQRRIMYSQREEIILKKEDIYDSIVNMYKTAIYDTVASFNKYNEELKANAIDLESLFKYFDANVFPANAITLEELKDVKDVKEFMYKKSIELLTNKREEIKFIETNDKNMFNEFLKSVSLRVIDIKWTEHIDRMAALKQSIGLKSYAQINPLREYQNIGFEMFEAMSLRIAKDITKYTLRAEIRQNSEREQVNKETGTNKVDDSVKKKPKVKKTKVKRNDPCSCNSGKKFKVCCGK